MNVLGWYTETPTGNVTNVSKIHITRNGQTTLCGRRPSTPRKGRIIMDPFGAESCSKCEAKHWAEVEKERAQ